jgi:hypothetical protein
MPAQAPIHSVADVVNRAIPLREVCPPRNVRRPNEPLGDPTVEAGERVVVFPRTAGPLGKPVVVPRRLVVTLPVAVLEPLRWARLHHRGGDHGAERSTENNHGSGHQFGRIGKLSHPYTPFE